MDERISCGHNSITKLLWVLRRNYCHLGFIPAACSLDGNVGNSARSRNTVLGDIDVLNTLEGNHLIRSHKPTIRLVVDALVIDMDLLGAHELAGHTVAEREAKTVRSQGHKGPAVASATALLELDTSIRHSLICLVFNEYMTERHSNDSANEASERTFSGSQE
jgi:hypothetical protein